MKNYDYWKMFVKSGRIDDYLHYIACTKEEYRDSSLDDTLEEFVQSVDKEGGVVAGIEYRDGNGSVSHAG